MWVAWQGQGRVAGGGGAAASDQRGVQLYPSPK